MRIHTSDKFIAWSALLSGLIVSAVAIYYSVAGLVAIFSAAVIPIIVMGVALEISKLSGTVWLKQNWSRAPYFIRAYLLAAIAILMLITSMGIFGFLSKAHSDQSLVSGDVQSRIAIYDEKIKTAKDNIDANRKALKQMDEAVDQVMGRSSDEKGAEKAVAIRRAQQKERVRLQSEIATEQKTVAALSEERAPIAAEVRKVEAEVGPIKYIANFIYGDNPDANVLEKAVTWVIIIIVVVFDPLAVILLLASQYSFQWFRKQEEEENLKIVEIETVPEEPEAEPEVETEPTQAWPIATTLWPFPSAANMNKEDNIFDAITQDQPIEETEEEKSKIDEWNSMIAEAEKAVEQEREEDSDIINAAPETEKQAMAAWKHDNPESSLKFQRRLLDKGIIDHLPWQDYIKPQADFLDDAAIEAKKWADENPDTEESEKAKEWAKEQGADADLSWMEKDTQGNQIKKVKESYQQNAEQNEKTLWQRIQGVKSDN
jgi:hypothetical protein